MYNTPEQYQTHFELDYETLQIVEVEDYSYACSEE